MPSRSGRSRIANPIFGALHRIRNRSVIDLGSKKIPIEVKLHSAPRAQDAGALSQCMRDLKLTIWSNRDVNVILWQWRNGAPAEEILTNPRMLFNS
jgi:hypothetical protein